MSRGLRSLAAVAVVVVLVALGARLLSSSDDGPDDSGSGQATERTPETVPPLPDGAPDEGMYVRSELTSDGEVDVQTWLRSPTPVTELDLTTTDPDLAPGSVESLDLVIRDVDGKVLARRDSVGTNKQTVELKEPAADLYLTYTVDGALDESSETVQGRELVRVLAMDVAYAGAAGSVQRYVAAPGAVINVACLRPREDFNASPRPCGGPTGDGDWQVELSGKDRDDRLLASVESGA